MLRVGPWQLIEPAKRRAGETAGERFTTEYAENTEKELRVED
jgi:hypothetical protein